MSSSKGSVWAGFRANLSGSPILLAAEVGNVTAMAITNYPYALSNTYLSLDPTSV